MHQPTSEGLFRTYSSFFVHPPTSERTLASIRQVLSSSSRLPNLLRLVFRQVLSERSLSSAEAFFKRQQTCASCHKRMIETLFRREHACEISHKRRFETLFKLGACLCTHHKRMLETLSRRDGLRVHHKRGLKHCPKPELCLCIRHKRKTEVMRLRAFRLPNNKTP